jgi:hypothetical protein
MAKSKRSLNWVPVLGAAKFQNDELSFSAAPGIPQSGNEGPLSLVKCNEVFQTGRVSCRVRLENSQDRFQFVLNHGLPEQVVIGLNTAGMPFGILATRSGAWSPLALSGQGTTVSANVWHDVSVTVSGSMIKMQYDGVEVVATQHSVERAQLGVLFQVVSSGDDVEAPEAVRTIHARDIKIHGVRPRVFVVMQFTPEFNALYEHVICPICLEFGYEVIRADDIFTNGLIISDITQSIRDASVVIADITPNNANVFYEVGYSHAIGKPTILLSDKSRDKLPFDVSGFRTLFYDNTIAGKQGIEERLRRHLENIPQG